MHLTPSDDQKSTEKEEKRRKHKQYNVIAKGRAFLDSNKKQVDEPKKRYVERYLKIFKMSAAYHDDGFEGNNGADPCQYLLDKKPHVVEKIKRLGKIIPREEEETPHVIQRGMDCIIQSPRLANGLVYQRVQ